MIAGFRVDGGWVDGCWIEGFGIAGCWVIGSSKRVPVVMTVTGLAGDPEPKSECVVIGLVAWFGSTNIFLCRRRRKSQIDNAIMPNIPILARELARVNGNFVLEGGAYPILQNRLRHLEQH